MDCTDLSTFYTLSKAQVNWSLITMTTLKTHPLYVKARLTFGFLSDTDEPNHVTPDALPPDQHATRPGCGNDAAIQVQDAPRVDREATRDQADNTTAPIHCKSPLTHPGPIGSQQMSPEPQCRRTPHRSYSMAKHAAVLANIRRVNAIIALVKELQQIHVDDMASTEEKTN